MQIGDIVTLKADANEDFETELAEVLDIEDSVITVRVNPRDIDDDGLREIEAGAFHDQLLATEPRPIACGACDLIAAQVIDRETTPVTALCPSCGSPNL